MYVGDRNANICSEEKPCKLVVDTGTTLLTGPSRDLKKLLSMI
jgi:cathepsin D